MSVLFYVSGVIAVIASVLVVTRSNAMHALVNLVVAFLAIASVLWTLGAPFAAVLQIVLYAGAILILFVFVVMLLNLGREAEARERSLLSGFVWMLPAALAAALLVAFVAVLVKGNAEPASGFVTPQAVGRSLYTTYLVGVELASMLLLAGLVAAFHFGTNLGRTEVRDEQRTN